MSHKDAEKRREYQRQYMRSWYANNKARHISYVRNREKKIKTWLAEYKKSLSCEFCGDNQTARLRFQHRDSQNRKFSISRIRNCPSLRALQEEIAKCRVLCPACYYHLNLSATQLSSGDMKKSAECAERQTPKFNRKQSQQLSMPYGTACARLRKILLFDLLVRHDENICFRCEFRIESVSELSIEHKQPWLDVSADLFWDLSNIAFSHLRCNRPNRPISERWKKKGLEGTAWCTRCKEFLPAEKFKKDEKHWNGLSDYCTPCHTKRHREWRQRRSVSDTNE